MNPPPDTSLDSAPSDVEVPAALQRSWIQRLRWHYDHINYQYVDSTLKRPLFLIGQSRQRLGEWNGARRTITISQHHILEHSWETVLDTLRHEMAHQYVHEHLGLPHVPPHGDAFREACRILRCEPDATTRGKPLERLVESNDERDRMLQRIKELFALAGSPNEHEAANAMRMAQKYLLKYNLDLTELDDDRRYETRFLGRCSARIQEYEYTLSTILQDHFFVMVIWTYSYDAIRDRSGKILQISGTPENLEIAEYVYHYVMQLAGPLWHERRREIRRAANDARRGGRRRGTKLQYLAGLVRGLLDKLGAQKTTLAQEHGLVWAGDSRLTDFYRYVNPRVRTISSSGVSRSNQYDAGVRDGKKIDIRRGLTGNNGNRGRLLE